MEHLIFSVGTQIVARKDVMTSNGRVAHPAGAVGVIVRSPVDRAHDYRVKFADRFGAAIHHDQLTRLADFKERYVRDADQALMSSGLYERIIFRCVIGSRVNGLEDEELFAMRDAFLSKLIFQTDSGYVASQFKKMQTDLRNQGRVKWKHVMHLVRLLISGTHVLNEGVVGLESGRETVEKEGFYDGLEIDLVTHDAEKFFTLMLRRNGYVLEQIFSPLIVYATPEFEELKSIAAGCVTRHHAHHYLGFAATQWKLFRKQPEPRVKPLRQVIRRLKRRQPGQRRVVNRKTKMLATSKSWPVTRARLPDDDTIGLSGMIHSIGPRPQEPHRTAPCFAVRSK